MRKHHLAFGVGSMAIAVSLFAALGGNATQPTPSPTGALRSHLKGNVDALGARPEVDKELVALGRALYHDPTLSSTNAVSCATCHPMSGGGTTPETLTKRGVNGKPVTFNTPTTWNAMRGSRQAWRADARDIPEILERPFFKDSCMGNKSWADIIGKLERDKKYPAQFAAAGVDIDKEGVDGALVAYLQAIEPRGSAADRFLGGDDDALSEEAQRGAALFESIGCVGCHSGAGLGGDRVARFGLAVADPYAERGQCADESYCRADADCSDGACARPSFVREADLGVPASAGEQPTYQFRVPSLRNVALTGPYFHDGSARTLDVAVKTMAKVQLGRTLTAIETRELVAFLGSLSGQLPPGELRLAMAATR